MLVLLLIIVSIKFAARTARNENVAVNLHHLFCRQSSSRMQIVHVLRNEQELIRALGKSCDCFVRSVRSRIADALAAVRDTNPKLIADRERTLPVSQVLSDQDFANSHPFREKSGCRFQPKHPRRSERVHAQRKIEKRQRFPNRHSANFSS